MEDFSDMTFKLGEVHPNHAPLTDESLCPVKGDFQDIPMGDVPAAYLDWLSGQTWLEYKYFGVYEYIQNNRNEIDDELRNEGDVDDHYQSLGWNSLREAGDGASEEDCPF